MLDSLLTRIKSELRRFEFEGRYLDKIYLHLGKRYILRRSPEIVLVSDDVPIFLVVRQNSDF